MRTSTSPVAKTPPDREVVARIALHLARVNADPSASDAMAAVRSDIDTFGLDAFFHAAVQTQVYEQTRAVQGTPAEEVWPPVVDAQSDQVLGLFNFPTSGNQGQVRQTWRDCISSRIAQPLRIYRPTTLADLKSIMQQADASNCRVKAVGSGHSFADVAGTRDFLVETHGLSRTIPLDRSLLRPGVAAETLFETEAGITVRDLNEALWNAGLGLENMGGYDGQTFAGVVSTSTHGSGIAFGPLASQVVSMTVVAGAGRTIRIEPAGGITEPASWSARHPDIELKQDDDWFNACLVGIGCMGIVYSVVLRARPRYFMKEQRTLQLWSQVRQELIAGQVLQDNEHYEVLVNPYSTQPNGDYSCLVTRRNSVPEPVNSPFEQPGRNFLIELISSIPGPVTALLAVLNSLPWSTPAVIDGAMRALVGDYVDRSYRVFNIGSANNAPAYGSEIGFPLSRCVQAIEAILAIAGARQAAGQVYLTSPFSLRFVKASPAYLSMMQGADTCMVEFIMLDHTQGGRESLQEMETQMYAFGGRPHWGLLNFLSGANGLIESMYPLLPQWRAIRQELDPDCRFANAFTERCGLTPLTFSR